MPAAEYIVRYGAEMKIKVMVAEDDLRLRQYLVSMLSTFPELQIMAAYENGGQLLRNARENPPDAVFLDVEMPELDGFATAMHLLDTHPHTSVVFITGHVEDGIRGYDIGATDYLPKPVSRDNLARAIGRITSHRQAYASNLSPRGDNRLVIKNGREVYFVDPAQVLFVEKVNRLCVIHALDKSYYSTESLDILEKRLGERFLRSHRGYIVNIDKVEKIEPESQSSLVISFYNFKGRALLSKNRLEEFMQRLSGTGV